MGSPAKRDRCISFKHFTFTSNVRGLRDRRSASGKTDQLVQVVLNSGRYVRELMATRQLSAKSNKLIAKERDEPAITILLERKNVL